jgi:8-hydroxy-5-deazaflavin:NADPH oxidoreductase
MDNTSYTRVSEEAPVDTASLREGGRKQQPGSPIYNNPMTAKVAHERLAEIA